MDNAVKQMNIEFSSSLSQIVEMNPSFDIGRLRIAYTGKNRNNTFISKESFEKAIPSMFNCPVVAHYLRDEDEIGSHDVEIVDKGDSSQLVYITQPIGMVPESAQWAWEDIEDNGVMHRYLCTDVVLWKRQEAYQYIKEHGIVSQSMEISITDGEMTDDYYDIKDFYFTAFCLLGENVIPCFESASLTMYIDSKAEFRKEYLEMLNELKLECEKNNTKEVEEDLDILKELLEKYQISEEAIMFDYKNLSDEELKAKFEYYFGDKDDDIEDVDEPDSEPEDDPEDDPEDESEDEDDNDDDSDDAADDSDDSEDFALDSDVTNALWLAIANMEKMTCPWDEDQEMSKYYYMDHDPEAKEVYFRDYETGNLYGTIYELDGDDIKIDMDGIKRKKFVIVDYVHGEEAPAEQFEQIEQFTAQISDLQNEIKELREYKQAKQAEELFAKFDGYEQLKDNKEYKNLKDHAGEYDVNDLEKEIYVLIGKACAPSNTIAKPAIGFETLSDSENKNEGIDKYYAFLNK